MYSVVNFMLNVLSIALYCAKCHDKVLIEVNMT
jgi:hypothetical protein